MVHGDTGGKSTDTQASDKSSTSKLEPCAIAGNLNSNTDHIEKGSTENGPTTAESVADPSRAKASSQGANAKNTDNGTSTNGVEAAVLSESIDEVRHSQEASDLASFVAEEETSDGGTDSHGYSFERYFALREGLIR